MTNETTMDLTPFMARGFPGNLDDAIANVAVRGIDREQAQGMIRLCPETESVLYGEDYSPRKIVYRKGSRPELEELAESLRGATPRQTAIAIMAWVSGNVIHPHLVGPLAPNRALSEEALIESKCGWCNEQARVFIALCEVLEIAARLYYVNHKNMICGHTAAELFLEGRWAFFDVTFNVSVELPDGRLAEGRELAGKFRDLAHAAYRPALEAYYRQTQPYVETHPGWCSKDRPSLEKGGDLLGTMGICNYLIEGVEPRH